MYVNNLLSGSSLADRNGRKTCLQIEKEQRGRKKYDESLLLAVIDIVIQKMQTPPFHQRFTFMTNSLKTEVGFFNTFFSSIFCVSGVFEVRSYIVL